MLLCSLMCVVGSEWNLFHNPWIIWAFGPPSFRFYSNSLDFLIVWGKWVLLKDPGFWGRYSTPFPASWPLNPLFIIHLSDFIAVEVTFWKNSSFFFRSCYMKKQNTGARWLSSAILKHIAWVALSWGCTLAQNIDTPSTQDSIPAFLFQVHMSEYVIPSWDLYLQDTSY